jgi:hypothetical protein
MQDQSANLPKKQRSYEKFSPDEDALLAVLAARSDAQTDWRALAAHLPGRTVRQCKERWTKYLNPDIRRDAWTPAEDDILRKRYAQFGTKWSKIALFLRNRTDYMAKNRWAQLRRQIEKDAKEAGGQTVIAAERIEITSDIEPEFEFAPAPDTCNSAAQLTNNCLP